MAEQRKSIPSPVADQTDWWIFKGDHAQDPTRIEKLPPPPSWRVFDANGKKQAPFIAEPGEIDAVNAALYLRRPLLVTGKPGTGKSSLAYAVAEELGLGQVLHWPIDSRSTVVDALYRYDAIGRLQAANMQKRTETGELIVPDIGQFIHLGPLGTALLPGSRPRVLLIDEIDKSDIDLPNGLLTIFEEGRFRIPELERMGGSSSTQSETNEVVVQADDENEAIIVDGKVVATAFPFVVITSNGERDLPAPFRRRCLPLTMELPGPEKLKQIAREWGIELNDKILASETEDFLGRREKSDLATDQLLNAFYIRMNSGSLNSRTRNSIYHPLNRSK